MALGGQNVRAACPKDKPEFKCFFKPFSILVKLKLIINPLVMLFIYLFIYLYLEGKQNRAAKFLSAV